MWRSQVSRIWSPIVSTGQLCGARPGRGFGWERVGFAPISRLVFTRIGEGCIYLMTTRIEVHNVEKSKRMQTVGSSVFSFCSVRNAQLLDETWKRLCPLTWFMVVYDKARGWSVVWRRKVPSDVQRSFVNDRRRKVRFRRRFSKQNELKRTQWSFWTVARRKLGLLKIVLSRPSRFSLRSAKYMHSVSNPDRIAWRSAWRRVISRHFEVSRIVDWIKLRWN